MSKKLCMHVFITGKKGERGWTYACVNKKRGGGVNRLRHGERERERERERS